MSCRIVRRLSSVAHKYSFSKRLQDCILHGQFCHLIDTPGKLSQVPPAEVLVIGCDRRPGLPDGQNIAKKGRCSSLLTNTK